MHTLQLDHHRLAWQLHAAQLHIRQLQHNLHSSHAQLQEKDQQASKAQELIEAKRARAVHRLFSNNQSFLLRSRFSEWRLEAHQQRSLRASSLQSVLSNGHQRCLATVWERWMAAVATQEADRWKAQLNDQKLKRARTMIAHHIAKSTTTVFHAWRQHVRHTRQRKRAILEAMLGKRELARQWKVWKHWTGKVLRKRTHITQQQLEEQREEREKERARHREEKERHEQEREARTKELEEKVASASKAAEKAAEERVLSASQTEAVTAARAAELVHKRVNAVMGRMLQGSLRTSFLAWRAQSRKAKQTRLDAVSLLLGKRSHTSIARAFRSWRAEARRTQQVKSDESAVQAAEEKRLAEYRAAEDKRQRSLAGMADAMSVKANRRQLVRSFEQWQRWSRERLQHRREAQRLVEQLCSAQQLQAAWCVWRQQISQAREEEKEDEYGYAKTLLATSRHQSLPQVAMSRTQPLSSSASRTARLSTSSTVLPSPSSSSHPAASRPSVLPVSSSAYRQLVSDHSSLLALYRRLFLLLQSLRGDVSRQWEAEAARLLQHTTCRCEQCAMRKTARAKGGAQLAWLRRYDQQIEGFRYVA
ncbi:hypothetical protein MMC34_008724 [Xylographa carneopallida]|nr:hypothetical protein [Xylographa carneopallida]